MLVFVPDEYYVLFYEHYLNASLMHMGECARGEGGKD